MIMALIVSIAVQTVAPSAANSNAAAPCQAVPALCMTSSESGARPLLERSRPADDSKMSAYRFDARPCRIVGNLDCPKQARLQLFRLGEPLRETLARSFTPR